MLRAMLCALALGLHTASAFQAPGQLSARWSSSSHLRSSIQKQFARTAAPAALQSTNMNYQLFSSQPQPSIRAQRILMDKQVRPHSPQAPTKASAGAQAHRPFIARLPPSLPVFAGAEPRPRLWWQLRHGQRLGPGQIQR